MEPVEINQNPGLDGGFPERHCPAEPGIGLGDDSMTWER